jgi:archaellum component FlaC
MAIKSQQDIKNENKAKLDKVPKSMESKSKEQPVVDVKTNEQPIVPLIQRVEAIENYLSKVDAAFERVVVEIGNLKKITQIMDSEISKITGDMVRLTKLEEDRYLELATGVNHLNDKITTLDEYIPIFVDKQINDYFEAITTENETSEQKLSE